MSIREIKFAYITLFEFGNFIKRALIIYEMEFA